MYDHHKKDLKVIVTNPSRKLRHKDFFLFALSAVEIKTPRTKLTMHTYKSVLKIMM